MEPDQADDLSWAELCDLHEAVALEEQAAELVLQRKIESGKEPTVEELVRLEAARAERERVERLMHDFSTTRRD